MRSPGVVGVLVLLVLCSCAPAGQEGGSGTGDDAADGPASPRATSQSPAPTASSTRSPAPAPAPAADVLTEADDGAQLLLEAGREVSLRLSSQWAWEAPVPGGEGLDVTPVDHLVDPGYQEWLLSGAAPAEVVLTAAGTPACDDPATCPARELSLTLTVVG